MSREIEDVIENKEEIYGHYDDQNEALATMLESLDILAAKNSKDNTGLSMREIVDYLLLFLKTTRTVTAVGPSEVDSFLDMANYSRLICRRRTGVDIAEDLAKLTYRKSELSSDDEQ